MADQRDGGIAWTDESWNPVRGCSRVSEGCRNCYAERVAARFSDGPKTEDTYRGTEIGRPQPYHGLAKRTPSGARWTGVVRLVPEHLADPLRWRRPRRVFVNSMSDLFHEALPEKDIAEVFGVMAVAGGAFHGPRDGHDKIGRPFPLYPGGKPVQMKSPLAGHGPHVFQVLTKRARRMRELLASHSFRKLVANAAYRWAMDRVCAGGLADDIEGDIAWPLPGVWLGLSVEDQQRADERIPHLLATPAAVRWVSYEPALGPVDFSRWMWPVCESWPSPYRTPEEARAAGATVTRRRQSLLLSAVADRLLDWIVVGGESGPGARPFDLAWARSTIRQCREAGVAAFFKQTGDYVVGDTLVVQDKRNGTPMHLGARRWVFDDGSEWVPPFLGERAAERPTNAVAYRPLTRGGKDPQWWPEDLRVRQFPEVRRG